MMSKEKRIMHNLHIIGDRVLIKPTKEESKTKNGLFLPPGYKAKEAVQNGFIVKTGPGYPIPNIGDDIEDVWKHSEKRQHYMPLQVKEGDFALFLQKDSVEIVYKDEKYFIVNQHNILLVERNDDTLFE